MATSSSTEAPRPDTVTSIAFSLNDRRVALELDPEARLLYVLRNQLGACGTRFGCGAGHCGACFVLVDGHAVPACDTPMWAVQGKAVSTIEGLGTPQAPHALQAAFSEGQAVQCGYCASGILMSAVALLRHTPDPTETQVREALDRHLCRCGMQQRMVAAVLAGASALRQAAMASA